MSNDNGNGEHKEIKPELPTDVIDEVTLLEIVIQKHRDNTETTKLICREDLMVEHKAFLIDKLCMAIKIVMRATKRNKNTVIIGNDNMVNRLKNRQGGAFGKPAI